MSIKPEKPPEAKVKRSAIKNFQPSLKNLHALVASLRSPHGKLTVLQNEKGGNTVLTSTSRRLLQSLLIRKSVNQLLVTSTQGHLDAFKDGGLFVLSMAVDLVVRSLESDINSSVLAETFENILSIAHGYLSNPECSVKYKALTSDVCFINSFIKSIIIPKSVCSLNENDVNFIANLVLKVFLKSFSENEMTSVIDSVSVLSDEGHNINSSDWFEGLLLRAPELSSFNSSERVKGLTKQQKGQLIKVAMVTVSMSGDFEELSNVKYEAQGHVDLDNETLIRLHKFCDTLIAKGVRLVLCQKVVHPEVKLLLKNANIVVLERVGLQPVKFITRLTRCQPIQCLDREVPGQQYGAVDGISHVVLNGRSYLHLTRADNHVTTLLLRHQHEQHMEELKAVCESVLVSLEKLMYSPSVLAGAGCWQGALALYLQQQVSKRMNDLSTELDCSPRFIQEACNLFCQSLIKASIPSVMQCGINQKTGHIHVSDEPSSVNEPMLYNTVCQCGITSSSVKDPLLSLSDFCNASTILKDSGHKSSEDFTSGVLDSEKNRTLLQKALDSRQVVLDGCAMCLNALQTSVLSACSLLKIGQVMENL